MWPGNQKYEECKNNAGGSKDQGRHPVKPWGLHFFESGADAREKRSGDFGVGGGVKASIDGDEESLFFGESGAAGSARFEMRSQSGHLRIRTQSTCRIGAGGG